ncbi:MAG: TonB-dependent receptor [Bacteroidales bacterium]
MFSLCILLGTSSVFGQNSAKISGVLQDNTSKEKLLFANIVLIKASDSSQVKGMSSDANGKFVFDKLPKGKYLIRISTLGYHPYLSPLVELNTKNQTVDMGTLYLQSSATALEGVVVSAKKSFIEHLAGKMVMNVENNALTAGDNALELLKKMPGVFIDKEDAISLNGKKGVLVLIDDRSTHLSGSELANLLKSMPSSTIEKVETMDKPSSKYDAEGVSGIINFKTKKNNNIGFNGSLNAGLGYSGDFQQNAGLNLSYRGKKIGLSLAGDYYGQNSKSGYQQEQGFSDGTLMITNAEKEHKWSQKANYQGINAKASIDYFINDQHTLGLSFRESGGFFKQNQEDFTQIFSPSKSIEKIQRASSYSENGTYLRNRNNLNTNLNYQYIIDTSAHRKVLYVDATWLHNANKTDGGNTIHYFAKSNYDSLLLLDAYTLRQPIISDIFSIKADYEQSFSTKAKLEVGVKYSWVHNNNAIVYFQDALLDTSRSNEYIYKENIAAFYGIFNYDFTDKTSMQLGIRGEYTAYKGWSKTLDSTNSNQYFDLFPNINISQQIGSKHRFDLGYRYRLSRPSYTSLNPIIVRESANALRTGNPYLKPIYSHGLNLNYSFNYMIFASIDYTHSTGNIESLTYFDSTTLITQVSPVNAGKSNNLSASLSAQFYFFKVWQLNPYIQASFGETQIKYNNKMEIRPTFNAFAYISNNFAVTKTFSLQLGFWGSFPSKSSFSVDKGQYSFDFGAKKSFFDKKLTISLNVNDIFNTFNYRSDNHYPDGSYEKGSYYWASRSVFLSVRYQFGNQNLQMRQRKINELEEAGRLGGNGGGGNGKGGGK